jgi:hypothetical protein
MLAVLGSTGVTALLSVSVRNLSSMASIEAFASVDPVSPCARHVEAKSMFI